MDEAELDWRRLIFGVYNHAEVRLAVKSEVWQRYRDQMLDAPLEKKYEMLEHWIRTASPMDIELRQIQVTNYIHALKRGGLIK